MKNENPFALVRASDYTDEQINSLWVELGPKAIEAIIEPRSRISKFILGGKGTGKTHLLRYYSYPVARLRAPKDSGMSILARHQFLGVFLRATGIDAARFELSAEVSGKWQQLFGIYLELRLVESVLDVLCDIAASSPKDSFNDRAFIAEIALHISDPKVLKCKSLSDFLDWATQERRCIDEAVNSAAFAGTLDLHRIPFSLGKVCLRISQAISKWNPTLSTLPLIYLIDEIENFSEQQQQVLNSLIRYGEGLATFRVTGRLYARKTFSTISDGEDNREGSEFKTTFLDDILRGYKYYPAFAKQFITKRLVSSSLIPKNPKKGNQFDVNSCFDKIDHKNYFSTALAALKFDKDDHGVTKSFTESLKSASEYDQNLGKHADDITKILTNELPILLQKLNLLQFCKKYKRKSSQNIILAQAIRSTSLEFMHENKKGGYKTAYGHWANDLFAQLCRAAGGGVPYAGFDTFVKMSSGNPRNLLVILGRAYEIAAFKGIDFLGKTKLSISIQTEAAIEAARFMFERESNYGSQSEQARNAAERLATFLRTARYSLNIPEVSPLAVSFSSSDLTSEAEETLNSTLNFSFVFEIHDGRPDRNSQKINRKIQLNPLLSPHWGLPISRRGDISLGHDSLNAIFAPANPTEFDVILKRFYTKWNNPFHPVADKSFQQWLF